MKNTTLTLAAALSVLCASVSAAQIVPVRLSAPVNPVAGLPKLLPSPMTGPLAGMGISLPTVMPTLSPAPALLAAAAPAPLPVALPSRRTPLLPATPSRENVINPLRRIMPGVTVRFGEQKPSEKAGPDAERDNLGQLFDGDGEPIAPGLNRGPIGHERRISLPEDDLMRELGF